MSDKLTGSELEEALAARGLPSEGNVDAKRDAIARFDAEQLGQEAATTYATASEMAAQAEVTKLTMPRSTPRDESNDRIEQYEVVNPAGDFAIVRHNIDTGATAVVGVRPGTGRTREQAVEAQQFANQAAARLGH